MVKSHKCCYFVSLNPRKSSPGIHNYNLLVLNAGNGWEWGLLGLSLMIVMDRSLIPYVKRTSKTKKNHDQEPPSKVHSPSWSAIELRAGVHYQSAPAVDILVAGEFGNEVMVIS